jgi:hypothetical protein
MGIKLGLGSNIGRGLFVGWVEHPDIFCWVSFLYPTTCQPFLCYQRNPTKWPKIKLSPIFYQETSFQGPAARSRHPATSDRFGIIDFIITACYCNPYGIREHC